jgi:hypothetical protein
VVGSQNHGSNAYRIRQPFDFEVRIGTLAFDADLTSDPLLLGYLSVTIAEDPTPTPSWDVNGRGANPRNGLRIVFVNSAAIPSTETTVDEYPPGTFTTVVYNGLSLGYTIPDGAGNLSAPMTFPDVSLAGATRERLVFNGYYQGHDNNVELRAGNGRLRYALNDFPLHERAFTAGEIAMLDEPGQTGGFNHAIDVPLSELVEGDNQVRFSTLNIESGYPNAVVNLDLLIDIDPDVVFENGFDS